VHTAASRSRRRRGGQYGGCALASGSSAAVPGQGAAAGGAGPCGGRGSVCKFVMSRTGGCGGWGSVCKFATSRGLRLGVLWRRAVMSTHASVLVDSVGPSSAEVYRAAASFP
jgi:hypothetical protein